MNVEIATVDFISASDLAAHRPRQPQNDSWKRYLVHLDITESSKCAGIEAPGVIQQDITADEKDTTQDNLKMNEGEIVSSHEEVKPEAVSPVEENQCVEVQPTENEVRVGLEDNTTEKKQIPNGGRFMKKNSHYQFIIS